jgi:hypothetical protein
MRIGHIIYVSGALISVAGFVMAVVYALGVGSGTEVSSYVVRENNRPFRSFEIDLDPSMNPLRFQANAVVITSMQDKSEWYRGTLYLGNNAVGTHRLNFQGERDQLGRVGSPVRPQDVVNVESAGRYRYEVRDGRVSGRSAVERLEISVLRNVSSMEWSRLLKYLGVFFGAALFGTLFGEKPSFVAKLEDEERTRKMHGE